MLREGIDRDFDLAFSNELRVDHSITCPIITVRPDNDLPIVPIYTNIFAPPLAFNDTERTALVGHDHVALFEMGAHPFLTLTLWIGMFERDHTEPQAMQLDYAAKLAHVVQPYPDVST